MRSSFHAVTIKLLVHLDFLVSRSSVTTTKTVTHTRRVFRLRFRLCLLLGVFRFTTTFRLRVLVGVRVKVRVFLVPFRKGEVTEPLTISLIPPKISPGDEKKPFSAVT